MTHSLTIAALSQRSRYTEQALSLSGADAANCCKRIASHTQDRLPYLRQLTKFRITQYLNRTVVKDWALNEFTFRRQQ